MRHSQLRNLRPDFSWWRATLAMAFGIWIARPDQNVFTNTPAWDAFAGVAPEAFWGIVLLSIGTLQLGALWMRWQWLRAWGSFLATVFWGMFAYVFLTHMPTGLSWLIYTWLAAASLNDYLILARMTPSWWPGAAE